MTIQITTSGLRQVFPRAPQDIIDAFVAKQSVLDKAGITTTRTRLAYFLANIEHECGGFTIKNLTENINYTAERMAQVWPNRFSSASAVMAKYGTATGWQRSAFDDIYGNRMGNRPSTHDGSTYIGRGGPQWTGRDGYTALQNITGLQAVARPDLAGQHDVQPEVCAAFWQWKALNSLADAGDFKGLVRKWNGGTNGLADREHILAGNDPIIARLANVDRIAPIAKALPGRPPSVEPPKEVITNATKNERTATGVGVGTAGAGGVSKTVSSSTSTPADPPTVGRSLVEWSLIGVGVAVVIVAVVMLVKKTAAVKANWF